MGTIKDVRHAVEAELEFDPVDVTCSLQDALDRSALVDDDSDVSVDTSGNTVTLHGTSVPGPNATRWSAPRGWPAASCRSVTISTSPAD